MIDKALTEHAERLRKSFGGPMTPGQAEFLQDIQGFIEFGLRNGLSFALIASTIAHDLNSIARAGMHLEAALGGGVFRPMTKGYAKVLPDDVGGVNDADEDGPQAP